MDRSSPLPHEDRYLRWIGWLSLSKSGLLVLLAIGLLGFLHRDVDVIVGNWLNLLGMNMENRHIVRLLARLDRVTDKQLAQWSGITFAIAGVYAAEGTGLLLRQDWAKYLTIIATSAFIPFEIKESIKHFGWGKVALLAVNVLVVAYLVISLMREKRRYRPLVPRMAPQGSEAAVG
jgi:uncharacterized membrane protein (DUF2068 family)